MSAVQRYRPELRRGYVVRRLFRDPYPVPRWWVGPGPTSAVFWEPTLGDGAPVTVFSSRVEAEQVARRRGAWGQDVSVQSLRAARDELATYAAREERMAAERELEGRMLGERD